ncbi:MAG: hypothetical protein M1321_03080 [Candidatus Marsarchaeota archaeon]|nr:hypothetical protein [Candidatus Marsarchaeota archaeon]
MRLQFATMEAIASAMVVAVTITAVSASVAQNNSSAYSSLREMRLGFAEHDFMAQAYGNASLRSCIAEYLNGANSCIFGYEAAYADIYGIQNFTVSRHLMQGGECFAVPFNGILCIGG